MNEHEPNEIIAEVPKNDWEVVRVTRTTYNGKDLLDVRVWIVPATPGEKAKPTKKGLTLRPETWAELTPALSQAVGMELVENDSIAGHGGGRQDGGPRGCPGN